MTDTTQPPAETLAEAQEIAIHFALPGMYDGISTHATRRGDANDKPYMRAILAALTRRAGGDAIPAGETCTCQRFPTHQANDCPAHGLEPPFDGVPHNDAGPTVVAPQMTEAEAREMLLHNSDVAIIQVMRDWGFIRATPKPPAGGDAGAVREELRERCALAAYAVCARTRHVMLGDQVAQAIRALALPAPVVEGWHDIETASRDCVTEIDMWCASAEANGEGWNLRGILMVGTPDWIKREDGSDYFPHENGGFLTHWRPVPAPPAAARAALSEGRSHG